MIILKNDNGIVTVHDLKTREKNQFHIMIMNDVIEVREIKSIEVVTILEGDTSYKFDDKISIFYELNIEYSFLHRGYHSDLTNNNQVKMVSFSIQGGDLDELKAIKNKLLDIKKQHKNDVLLND